MLQGAEVRTAVGPTPAARLRLCFVVESGVDVRMVEGLAERFDLSVLARRIGDGIEITHPPCRPVPITIGRASRSAFALQVARHVRARRGSIDFVLVQGYGPAALAANLASRLAGCPAAMLVCSPAEAYYRCRKEAPALGRRFRRREYLALSAVALANAAIGGRYLVLSRYLADVVGRRNRHALVDIVPVYGVDTQLFAPPRESKAALRARLGLPAGGSLLFFSSRIAPEKDCETLLAAAQRLLRAGRDLWLLHRSGGYRDFLAAARRLGVAQRVIATGPVHPHRELPRDYQASDLCVQSSREEGLGFSPLEALACGVPVIAAAVGGLRETIIDGRTGWTYPVGDPGALAARIESVLDQPLEAARRAAAGRELVCRSYDARMVFDRLQNVIERSTTRRASE